MNQLALRFDVDNVTRPATSAALPTPPGLSATAGSAVRPARTVSPLVEMGAYEALWLEPAANFARLAELFRRNVDALPSQLVGADLAASTAREVMAAMAAAGVERFGVRVHGAGEYPSGLRDARNPVELLYFQGWWNLVESPCVAVVGTRKPSGEGLRRAASIAAGLAADGWTIVSGLARGVDTAAHRAVLGAGGRSFAVIGTPLTDGYPPENAALQRELADHFLVVSQVPVLRYRQSSWQARRSFFPERNATMSALTAATLIVEAGDTSGTLHQARAALQQGRKLLILESCFNVPGLHWPHRYERLGALRVRDLDAIREELGPPHQD